MPQHFVDVAGIQIPPSARFRLVTHFLCAILAAIGTILEVVECTAAPPVAQNDASVIKAAAANTAQTQDRRTVFTVSGRVSDPNYHPLANVSIYLHRIERDQAPIQIDETKSDADGLYRFSDIPSLADKRLKEERYYAIVVTAPKLESIFERVPESDRVEFDVRMRPAVTIKGRVVDPDGKPVKGALIWDDRFRDGTLRQAPIPTILNATTDADGQFSINDLPQTDGENNRVRRFTNQEIGNSRIHRLAIHHPDFADQLTWLVHAPADGIVNLAHAGTIRGKVVDQATGRTAAGIAVTIQPTKQSTVGILDNQTSRSTQTDANGEYQFQSLTASNYNVWATSSNRSCVALNSVPVVAKVNLQVSDLKLVEGGWIEGQIVTLQGQPVSCDAQTGERLKVGLNGPSRPKTGVSFESTDVDDEGHFRLRVPAGRNFPFLLSRNVWHQTWRAERFERGINVASGETVSVKFRIIENPHG